MKIETGAVNYQQTVEILRAKLADIDRCAALANVLTDIYDPKLTETFAARYRGHIKAQLDGIMEQLLTAQPETTQ